MGLSVVAAGAMAVITLGRIAEAEVCYVWFDVNVNPSCIVAESDDTFLVSQAEPFDDKYPFVSGVGSDEYCFRMSFYSNGIEEDGLLDNSADVNPDYHDVSTVLGGFCYDDVPVAISGTLDLDEKSPPFTYGTFRLEVWDTTSYACNGSRNYKIKPSTASCP
jgi:hypothetical protein